MSAWLPILIDFYSPDWSIKRIDIALNGLTATQQTIINRIGNGKVEISQAELENLPVGYPEILPGDIAVVYTGDFISGEDARIGAFFVKNVEVIKSKGGTKTILSGPDMLDDLNSYPRFIPIGESFTTTLKYNITAAGATGIAVQSLVGAGGISSPLRISFNGGENGTQVDDATLFSVGDRVVIPHGSNSLGDGSYRGTVTEVNPPYGLEFDVEASTSCDSGNPVEVSWIQKGDGIKIFMGAPLGDDSYLETIIDNEPSTNGIEIHQPTFTGANAGSEVTFYPGSKDITVGDIDTLMEPAIAGGWVVQNGTSSVGTSYRPNGASVFSLLRSAAEATGDFFRVIQTLPAAVPHTLRWMTEPDTVPALTFTIPDLATGQATYENTAYAVVHEFKRVGKFEKVTHVSPIAGDPEISIEIAPDPSPPFYKVYEDGAWTIYNADLAADRKIHRQITFSNVVPEFGGESARAEAAADLQQAAIDFINASVGMDHVYVGKAVIHGEIEIGQEVTFQHGHDYWSEDVKVYVSEYTHTVAASGRFKGIRVTSFVLTANTPREVIHPLRAQTTIILGGSQVVSSSVSGGGGGGPGTPAPGVTDHGALTGLSDIADHPGYLVTSGARALTGNMAVIDGVTIDGVDISQLKVDYDGHIIDYNAHKADPEAHQPLVTVDSPLVIAQQHVSILFPTDSGLVGDVTGLYMGDPTPVQKGALQHVTGSTHGHQVISTADGIGTPDTLLHADANGRFAASGIGVGRQPTGDGLYLVNQLEFSANATITTLADDLTLAPAGDLIFNPTSDSILIPGDITMSSTDWIQGATGWGIFPNGNADFRNIKADELIVGLFRADEKIVIANTHLVTPGMGIVDAAWVIPDVGLTVSITFKDSPQFPATAIFRESDRARVFVRDTASTGLTWASVWGVLTGYTDNADGTQDWTFTTSKVDAAIVGDTVPAEAVFFDYGASGSGFHELTAGGLDTGPTLDISTWEGTYPHDAGAISVRLRLGQVGDTIAGITGKQYGAYIGQTPSTARIIITDQQAGVHHMPIHMYYSGEESAAFRITDFRLEFDSFGAIAPDGDISNEDALSSGSTFYDQIGWGSGASTYISNDYGASGEVRLSMPDMLEDGLPPVSFVAAEFNVVAQGFTLDDCTITLQLIRSDNGQALTSEDQFIAVSDGLSTIDKVFTTLYFSGSVAAWTNPILIIKWGHVINGSEVETIRLEPKFPAIEVGDPLPTGEDKGGDGIWMGRNRADNLYHFRVGGTSGSGVPRMVWDGDSLQFRNGPTNSPLIEFDSLGNSRFVGTMTIEDSGEIVANHTRLFSQGIEIEAIDSTVFDEERGYTFETDTGHQLGGIYGRYYSTGSTENLIFRNIPRAVEPSIEIIAESSGAYGATVYIRADSPGFSSNPEILLTASDDEIWLNNAPVKVDDSALVRNGLIVGRVTGTPVTGQAAIYKPNQSATIPFRLADASYTWGTSHGLTYIDSHLEAWAASPQQGGAVLRAASSSTHAMWIRGDVTTGSARNLNGDARVPLHFTGYKSNGSLVWNEMLAAFSNNNVAKLIVMAEGTVISDGNGEFSWGLTVGENSTSPLKGQVFVNDNGANQDALILKSTASSQPFYVFGTSATWVTQRRWSTQGGGIFRGMSAGDVAVSIDGFADAPQTTTGTTSTAGILMRCYDHNGSGGVQNHAAGRNIVVIRNGATTDFIFKSGGTAYANISWTTWDEEDDLSLVRAYGRLAPNAIENKWDKFVSHNADDLHNLGLVVNGMTNMTGMMQLHNGALWQVHSRLAEIENMSITSLIKLLLVSIARKLR